MRPTNFGRKCVINGIFVSGAVETSQTGTKKENFFTLLCSNEGIEFRKGELW